MQIRGLDCLASPFTTDKWQKFAMRYEHVSRYDDQSIKWNITLCLHVMAKEQTGNVKSVYQNGEDVGSLARFAVSAFNDNQCKASYEAQYLSTWGYQAFLSVVGRFSSRECRAEEGGRLKKFTGFPWKSKNVGYKITFPVVSHKHSIL